MKEITLTMPDTLEIPIAKGLEPRVMKLDVDKLAPEVILGAIENGFRQAANDAHSQVTAEEVPDKAERAKQALAAATKRRDEAWYAGIWARAGGGSRGPSDPLLKEMRTLARSAFSLTAKVTASLDREAIMERCKAKAVMILAREGDVDPKAVKAKDRDERAEVLYGKLESKAQEIVDSRDLDLEA